MSDKEPKVLHMVGMFSASLENIIFLLILGVVFFQMLDCLGFAEGMEGRAVLSQIKIVS